MTKAACIILGLILLSAGSGLAQTTPTQQAAEEGIRREARTIELRQKMVQADAAWQRGDVETASKLYQTCYDLTEQIGPAVDAERQQVVASFASVVMVLAERHQKMGRYDL